MRSVPATLCLVAVAGLTLAAVAIPAQASARPAVTRLSAHHAAYWGDLPLTIRGTNLTGATQVLFGSKAAHWLTVVSDTELTVVEPEHSYGTVHVRVVTPSGTSTRNDADMFTFTRPTLNSPIQGGLTARQERRSSARARAAHHRVHVARRSRHWTPAMGRTAMLRARSWLGVPYSWAGGNRHGPTTGVCAHNGGDMDCHVVGFDCSGLALYSWAPYESLVHYASTQHRQAGRFHPHIGELMPGDLVFFAGYIPGGIGHVAVYQGHGVIIQAAQSGTLVMRSRLADVIAGDGPYRGATRPMSTGRQGRGPQVSSVTSNVAASGGHIMITGRGLRGTTSVSIGRTTLYSFVKRTSTHLVVRAPAHEAGRARVVVSNAWGAVRRSVAYVAPPQVASMTPSHGPASGGTVVTVVVANARTVSGVTVGTARVAFTVLGPHRLTLTTPAHTPESVPVILYSAFGRSRRNLFTFDAAPTRARTPPGGPPSASSSPSPTSKRTSSAPSPTSTPTSSSPTSTSPPPTSPSSSPAPSAASSTGATRTTPAPASTGTSGERVASPSGASGG